MSDHSTLYCASDLHLSRDTPHTLQAFENWLAGVATEDAIVWLLGDIFEVWYGDDYSDECTMRFERAVHSAVAAGATLSVMHGNRDFLLGEDFAERCGMTLQPDPEFFNIAGRVLMLTHGDALCTDDTAYQAFRRQSREVAWQKNLLSQPLNHRIALAKSIRQESTAHKANSALSIQDVNAVAVQEAFLGRWPDGDYIGPCHAMVHGHTHRCAVHIAGGKAIQGSHTGQLVDGIRIVLPDWNFDTPEPGQSKGGFLSIQANGAYALTVFN
nr:UDP-2,3-diacylglucosamine diphosphatase [Limnobacter humi]